MALNEKFHDANRLSLPVLAGKVSGDPVRVGGLNGVCLTKRSTTAALSSRGASATTCMPGSSHSASRTGVMLSVQVATISAPCTASRAESATTTSMPERSLISCAKRRQLARVRL